MTDHEIIYQTILKLGKNFFLEEELSRYIEQMKDYKIKFIAFFTCITQEKESVHLETSYLTDKIIFDFTLTKNKNEVCIIPLNKIKFIQNTITDNQKMVLTIFSDNNMFLKYKTFNIHDTDVLKDYCIVLTNKLNSL